MHKLWITALTLVAFAAVAFGQTSENKWSGWVEVEAVASQDQVQYENTKFGLRRPLGKEYGLQTFALMSRGYSEGLLGVYRVIGPIELGVSAGLETDKNPWRVGGYIAGGHKKDSFFLALEEGGSGFWYRFEGNHTLSKKWTVGPVSQRFAGTGGHVRYRFNSSIALDARVLGSSQGTAGHLALQLRF